MNYQATPVSARELLIFYYKYRTRLWLAFWVPMLLFVALSFVPTPRYAAQATLIVRLGSEYVYQPETGNNTNSAAPTIPFDREQVARSELAILSSDAIHRDTITAVGLDKLYPKIAHPEGVSALILAIENWFSPLTPEQWQENQLERATLLFDKRFDILLEKESAVIQISYEHPDAAIAAETLNSLLTLYFDKRKQIYLEPRAELASAQMQATHERALAAQQAVEAFKQKHKIYSLNDERAELLRQRAEVDRQLITLTSSGLHAERAAYDRRLDQLDAQERELSLLEKEVQIADEAYSLYSHQLDEAKASETLQRERIGSVRVIQPPIVPPEPKRLQLIIILVGFFLSVLSVLTMAGVTEYLKSGFLTPEQMERDLRLPVLAVLPFAP